MGSPLPHGLENELETLVKHIRDAFRDVSREGGVSWNETMVLDDYGGMEERLHARETDTDQEWMELVDDPEWPPKDWRGGACFLDAIGFRYYLPVLMLRELAGDYAIENLEFHLQLGEGEFLKYSLNKWALLDHEQRKCVRRFLRYMVASLELEHAGWGRIWQRVLDSYWEESA